MNHLFLVQTESPVQPPSQENQLSKVNSGGVLESLTTIFERSTTAQSTRHLPRLPRYDELNMLDAPAESAGTFSAIAMELPFPAVFPLLDGEN